MLGTVHAVPYTRTVNLDHTGHSGPGVASAKQTPPKMVAYGSNCHGRGLDGWNGEKGKGCWKREKRVQYRIQYPVEKRECKVSLYNATYSMQRQYCSLPAMYGTILYCRNHEAYSILYTVHVFIGKDEKVAAKHNFQFNEQCHTKRN
jgi:hypothetical protein